MGTSKYVFLTCGFSAMRKLLPMSSVAKSMTEPFSNDMDTASTMIFEGFMVGWEK